MISKQGLGVMLCVAFLAVAMLPIVDATESFEKSPLAIGDKWTSRLSDSSKDVYSATVELVGDDTLNVGSYSYNVFDAKISMLDLEDFLIYNMGADFETSYVKDSAKLEYSGCIEKISQDIVQYDIELSFKIKDENDTIYDCQVHTIDNVELISKTPETIVVGSTWTEITKTNSTTTSTIDSVPQDPEISETTETYNCECLGKKTVTASGKTFDTYEIK